MRCRGNGWGVLWVMLMSEELPFCKCGCGGRVSKKGNKFIHGHNCGNQGKKHPGINTNPQINKFVEDNQGKHICSCGCGELIEIKSHHYTIGIPEFIHGHNRKKPDVVKLCEWCGEEFIVKGNYNKSNRKFCSGRCRYEYQAEIMRDKPGGGLGHGNRVGRIIIICSYCGDEFEVRETESNRKFCCHKCYTDWYSENLVGESNSKWKGRIIKQCKYCGEDMELPPHESEKIFCCYDCKYQWYSENKSGENSPLWIERTTKLCKYCGEEMLLPPWDEQRTFCSRECMGRWLSENNCGENNPCWTGGMDAQQRRRRGLGYEPLNDKFPGSDGHHITETLVIHIPKELHQHVGHNLRSGKNMNVINKLAFQYLFGCYNG